MWTHLWNITCKILRYSLRSWSTLKHQSHQWSLQYAEPGGRHENEASTLNCMYPSCKWILPINRSHELQCLSQPFRSLIYNGQDLVPRSSIQVPISSSAHCPYLSLIIIIWAYNNVSVFYLGHNILGSHVNSILDAMTSLVIKARLFASDYYKSAAIQSSSTAC